MDSRAPRWSLHLPLWLGAVTALAFVLGTSAAHRGPWVMLAAAAFAAVVCVVARVRIERRASRPLRTAANVVDAMRLGDYTHRARRDLVGGPLADLLDEINRLAAHLSAERGRAEENAALLQALVERVDVALLAFDDARVLRWWNPAAERVFGTRLRAGSSASALGAEELLAGPSERSVALPGNASSGAWELRRGAFRRAGQRYEFVLLASAQRVRREEERAAWQRLVRVLGHEVNNTLAPIQSLAATCSGMLEDDGERAVPQVREALDVIERRAASLTGFISEFARLARLPEPRLRPLELGALVRGVVPLDARCPVHVTGKPPVHILADGPLLEQALVNLIRNAIDASLSRQGQVTLDWQASNDAVVLSIIDEGPGIANRDNLFVPLFSTKPGGSGIGLVLARNIVEAHGGELRLENRARAPGCVASLTLPRAPHASQPTDGAGELGHPREHGAG